MNDYRWVLGLATLLGAAGMWLLLPRGGAGGRKLGAVLGLASLALAAWQMPALGDYGSEFAFWVLSAITLISAVAAVTLRSPVYCAIWFALSLLGTAGLFLFQGAQFLGVATIVVYAGAILVTFLFVLMLAQPQGDAFYDRISWEGLLSAGTGALMVGVLTLTIAGVFRNPVEARRPQPLFSAAQLDKDILADQHMAHLGGELFSRYLIPVEIAGTLLLVALVGAVAIVGRHEGRRGVGQRGTGIPAADAPPRIDPRIVTGREPVTAASVALERRRQEVTHG